MITIRIMKILVCDNKCLPAHDELGTCGASPVCSINLPLMWLQQSAVAASSALRLFGHWRCCVYADTVGGGASKLNIETDHPGWMLTLTLRWGVLLTLTLSCGLLLTRTFRWELLLILTLRWGLPPGSPCQSGNCGTSALPGLGL